MTRESDKKSEDRDQTEVRERVVAWGKKYRRIWTVLICLLCGIVGIALVSYFFPNSDSPDVWWMYLLREVGKALFIAAVVSTLWKFLLEQGAKDLEEDREELSRRELNFRHEQVQEGLCQVDANVAAQTTKLLENVTSLNSLHRADVSRVYTNRGEAADVIMHVLQDPELEHLQLIGISLNDFLRDEDRKLRQAWRHIEKRLLRCKDKDERTLRVEVLLIDPHSRGGYLRAQAENTQDQYGSRLKSDVTDALAYLRRLGEDLKKKNLENCLSVRLYGTAPQLYLVRTPGISFVQQYYFRESHGSNVNIPLLSFMPRSDKTEEITESMHDELDFHFKWLWKHSMDMEEIDSGGCLGVDEAVRQAGITNMYFDKVKGHHRILHLMRDEANKRLWIKGISLHSFFDENSDLYEALLHAIWSGKEVRILIISPDGEQAYCRSFREYLIDHPDAKFDEFAEDRNLRERQKLFKDTMASISILKDFVPEKMSKSTMWKEMPGLDGTKNLELGKDSINNEIGRAFFSAPEAFMLLTDHSVIVEQYHYGKIAKSHEGPGRIPILGKDVPLIEYANPNNLSSHSHDALKQNSKENIEPQGQKNSPNYARNDAPYRLFEDSFRYVWDHCSRSLPKE